MPWHRLLGPPCPRRPSLGVDGIRMYGSHHLTKQGGERLKRNCTDKTPPTHPARPNNCRRCLRTRETCRRPAQINPPSHAPGARIRASDSCGTTVLKYKPLHRMTPKLREKSRPYSQSFGPTTDTTYNRPAGFTQPGHPTVAPLLHLSSPEKNRRHQAGFPYGHSGKLLTQLTDARQPALPGN